MILSSKVLDEMQKTRLLVLATKVSKAELQSLYNLLNAEKEQLDALNQNYQRTIERYENMTEEIDADAKEKAEADKILNRLKEM